jgi:hypothetical protein
MLRKAVYLKGRDDERYLGVDYHHGLRCWPISGIKIFHPYLFWMSLASSARSRNWKVSDDGAVYCVKIYLGSVHNINYKTTTFRKLDSASICMYKGEKEQKIYIY